MKVEMPTFEVGGDGQEYVSLVFEPEFAMDVGKALIAEAKRRTGKFYVNINCAPPNTN